MPCLQFHGNCFERKCVWRIAAADGTTKEGHGVAFFQKFDAGDQVVFVWTLSVHTSKAGSPPLFRASCWMTITHSSSTDPRAGVTSRFNSRVHAASPRLPGASLDGPSRCNSVRSWSDSIQAKQERMEKSLALLA